jgi:signal transduction histidine kinase/ligand-binding sensor domain-containing protein
LEGKQWQIFGTESGFVKSYITSVLDLGNGALLCGAYDKGLLVFQDGHATAAKLDQIAELDGVLSLQEDKLGNIWAGTRTQGLLRLRKPSVRTVPGSEKARIARTAFDNRGRFWVGSADGLWYEQGEKFVQAPVAPGLTKIAVATLTPCPEGGMWIAVTRNGLWEFDPDRHQQPFQKMKGTNDDVMGVLLAPDGAGGFWFGNESGAIGHLRDQKTNLLTQLQRPADKRVVQLMGDSGGGVWARIVGTGMVRVDGQGKQLERVGPAEGLPVNSIRCWLGDGEGGLWMGSPMGLYWWHKSKLLLFDTRHGLPEDLISNLADDLSGHLWCATHSQLFRLTKKELEDVGAKTASVVHPRVIGPSAGLKAIPFASGIASRAIHGPDGRLFFPRIGDVISIDPADFEKPEPAPQVVVEEVFVDGRRVELPEANRALRIPTGTGDLAVRYTALQSAAPETLHFRYRFDGADNDWSEAVEQRVVNFRHLPPGPYRFRVTASSAGGAWAEPGASLDWEVQPYFWQTATFRVLGILAIVGAIGAFGWSRFHALEKRRAAQELFSRRLLESQEAERRRIAAELHDSLGQNLVLVKNLAAQDGSGNGHEKSNSRSPDIVAAADRALAEVHAISYALRPPELDRLGLAKAIAAMVRRAEDASEIKFEAHIELAGALSDGADIQLFRIAQEAVNNLVKHSGAKTARVELWRDEAGVHLVVADDGRGLAEKKANSGNGLGLSGIEERARLIVAQCKWLSQPGQGTTLSVLIPGKAG